MCRIKISDTATLETRQIYEYLSDYSPAIADKHLICLTDTIAGIGRDPMLWSYFFLTGAPYRAKLFLVGKTSFWIIYAFDEGERTVDILRIWNSKQNPDDFDL